MEDADVVTDVEAVVLKDVVCDNESVVVAVDDSEVVPELDRELDTVEVTLLVTVLVIDDVRVLVCVVEGLVNSQLRINPAACFSMSMFVALAKSAAMLWSASFTISLFKTQVPSYLSPGHWTSPVVICTSFSRAVPVSSHAVWLPFALAKE